MILTSQEKELIIQMKQCDSITFDDETRENYQYEVEKTSTDEYRVSKFAIMCLSVDYFETAEQVINFIEK